MQPVFRQGDAAVERNDADQDHAPACQEVPGNGVMEKNDFPERNKEHLAG